jgi:hypothetical protein
MQSRENVTRSLASRHCAGGVLTSPAFAVDSRRGGIADRRERHLISLLVDRRDRFEFGPASPRTIADAESCPVTTPGKAPAEIGDRLFGSAYAFGNSDLWVGGLGPDGVIPADSRFVESDGSIGWKLGWWRIASGTLTITGRRLDAPAPPLRASVPDGYGPQGFQASGVYFSTEGCWEVTGTVASSELTFVTFVFRT